MKPYVITGRELRWLIDAIAEDDFYALRVAIDEGGVKFKFDNGTWSTALGKADA
jgi:hypothetical protein